MTGEATESTSRELQWLVQTYGPGVTEDRRRCEALLRDMAGENRREVNMLVSALAERVPSELLSGQGRTPTSMQLQQLTRRLQDNQGLTETSARWAVGAWAVALGTASQMDVDSTFSNPPADVAAPQVIPPAPLAGAAVSTPSNVVVAPPVAAPAQVRYAGFWVRALAVFIDGMILGIVSVILSAVVLRGASGATVYYLVSVLVGWLYSAYFWSSPQQATLGKMAVGVIVTDEQGGRIPFSTATVRYFSEWLSGLILGIGFLMAAWDSRKQALHDKIAHTTVRYKNP